MLICVRASTPSPQKPAKEPVFLCSKSLIRFPFAIGFPANTKTQNLEFQEAAMTPENLNGEPSKNQKVARMVGITTLASSVPLIALGVQLHDMYVGWHDDNYVRRGDTITLAQANEFTTQLSNAATRAIENSEKLDRILIDQARRDVWDAEDRLSQLKSQNAQPQDIREAQKRLEQCREYYECLTHNDGKCGLLRGI